MSQMRQGLTLPPDILLNNRNSAATCNTISDINNSKCLSFL